MGKQDIVFAGGSEEIHWAMTAMFDAMTALFKNIIIHQKKRPSI